MGVLGYQGQANWRIGWTNEDRRTRRGKGKGMLDMGSVKEFGAVVMVMAMAKGSTLATYRVAM